MGNSARTPHRWSIVVARIAAIDIRVHVSFLVLVVLFAVAAPEPGVIGALWSLVWLVAVFGSVVLHELAHCVVARARGADVHEILLFPLGGISKLERLPETPRDEFAVAIVGPLASLGIGATAAVLCVATGRDLLPFDLLTGAWLERIAWLNLILGAFNLLPAFPLDGGRVLRSLLERHRDLLAATRVATRTGHVLAGLLIAVGVLFDPWLALIGAFVYFGASAEEAATIVHVRLQGHRVRDLMRPLTGGSAGPPREAGATLDADTPLDVDVVARLQAAHGVATVVADGREVGELRLDDVSRFVAEQETPSGDRAEGASHG
ncbi:MAG: site-2 protease family protein [Acidimicrobiia bacterium]